MREIKSQEITDRVARKLIEINLELSTPLCISLEESLNGEESSRGRELISQLLENARIAREERIPICQDTGMVVAFARIGEGVRISGNGLEQAINRGVAQGYKEGNLRKSMVLDPIFERKNSGDNTPAIVHTEVVPGEELTVGIAAKGGGSENMSQLKMLKPADGPGGIIDFVCRVVEEAGPNPCPPLIIGLGVGGSMEKAAVLAKKALFLPLDYKHPHSRLESFSRDILAQVNKTGVGPLGLGGRTTALKVNLLTHPCHIASLPVAVNLNCHAARHGHIEF